MERIGEMADIFKLLGDRTRLTILAFLRERELCVCEIVELMGMTQPNISQHLRKLKSAGLVKETRRGQWIYYSLSLEKAPYVREVLNHLPSLREKIQAVKPECCD